MTTPEMRAEEIDLFINGESAIGPIRMMSHIRTDIAASIRAAERESEERMREAAAKLADESCAAKVAAAIRALPLEE